MAPQVGLEPTTDRLTADSSTTELLWINVISIKHKYYYSNYTDFFKRLNPKNKRIFTLCIDIVKIYLITLIQKHHEND